MSLGRANTFSVHQACHAMMPKSEARASQTSPNAWTAIGLAPELVFHSDLLDQHSVLQLARTFFVSTLSGKLS